MGQPETGVRRVRERRSPSRGIRRRGDRNEVLPADWLDVATLDWFLVRVLAGQEITARDILRAAGFGTCLPMQRKWQRANRYHKRREQREYAVLPGYLFAGMSALTPGWPVLVEPRQVVSVVGLDGRPYRIAKVMIDAIVAQYDSLYYPCPVVERPALDYAAGDLVQVIDGPFDRHVVKVERIGAKSATVLVKMFGRDMAVQVGLDALVKKA
jgi:transcription antitermination factor NusG